MLDAGLAVLSLASGSVLGAFLVGTLIPRVDTRAMLSGMIAGLAAMLAVWLWSPLAWTWYAFVGAGVTIVVAFVLSFVFASPAAVRKSA